MEVMLEIKDLQKRFGENQVLKGINFTVYKGETVALLGASGSGKSTLLRCINLLEVPDEGTVKIADLSFSADRINKQITYAVRKNVAMVFQQFGLFENKTALENVTEALIVVKKMKKEKAIEMGKTYLEKVGLLEHAQKYPGMLSGGQKQRVAIARALALKPQMILFDEPTSALDPELVQEVLGVIRQVAEEKTTMIIVTHEMEFAKSVSDRVAFMSEGRILEMNTSEEFFKNPQTERAKQFLNFDSP